MAIDAISSVLLQSLIYIAIAPLVLGTLRRVKARFQGRQGPRSYQPYLDLWKLFHRQPVIPETTSWLFTAAPYIVFICYTFLGMITPIVFLQPGGQSSDGAFTWLSADVLLVVYVLGLARFVLGLAGMDAGSPFGGLGSGRELFIHVLTEPTLIVVAYALALNAHTTSLPAILDHYRQSGPLELYTNPTIWLNLLALALVTLAEAGRIPFDNPATHLELMMIGKAVHLEYAGRHLALLEWSEALRLTFFLTLLVDLSFPQTLAAPTTIITLNAVLILIYPLKLLALLLLLASWEMTRARMRLRAIAGPAVLALIFSVISVVVLFLERYGL